jgi:hypothetical protein
MNSRKRSKPSKPTATTTADGITVTIPKNKAAGGAAGAIVGGIVAGPLGAVVGGAVGASMAGNSKQVKEALNTGMKAAKSGVAAARKSDLGKRITKAATAAGESVASAYRSVKARVQKAVASKSTAKAAPKKALPAAKAKPAPKAKPAAKTKPAAKAKAPAKKAPKKA